MADLTHQILAALMRKSYQPLKPKALAHKLGVPSPQYADFRPAPPHGTVTGTYRRTGSGIGYVRPHLNDGQSGAEVRIPEQDSLDAATGDTVLVRITRKPN